MREMLFLTGGISQGKKAFARKLWKIWVAETKGTETAACREADGKTASWEAFQQADIAWNLQEMVRRILLSQEGQTVFETDNEESLEERAVRLSEEIPDRIIKDGCQKILIADEVGCGIVPLERLERAYRELAGRTACRIAAAAEAVWQVTAGIGRCIKGSEIPGKDGDAGIVQAMGRQIKAERMMKEETDMEKKHETGVNEAVIPEEILKEIEMQTRQAAEEFFEAARMKQGQILVVGCSSSEIENSRIGTCSSRSVGERVYATLAEICRERGIDLAAQCCEHLNRALILEEEAARRYGYEPVNVVPQLKAGGSFATAAYHAMEHPVAVEEIRADGGIDIGDTLIGMHLKPVAVPVRISVKRIGGANVVCARVRPKFIGGERAGYDPELA